MSRGSRRLPSRDSRSVAGSGFGALRDNRAVSPVFRRRQVALIAALCLVIALPVGGYIAYVSYVSFICPPLWWADQLANDLAEVVPDGDPAQANMADCDGGHEVSITFESADRDTVEAFRSVLARAEMLGWSQVPGEPWWGCWTKRIAGVPTTFRLRFDPLVDEATPAGPTLEERSYAINGTVAGGYCHGGKWADEDPANAGY